MTEREEEENDEFWIGEVEMVEAAYVVATKEKDAEITRLRAALEIIADDRLPGGRGPAEFARRALDGKP